MTLLNVAQTLGCTPQAHEPFVLLVDDHAPTLDSLRKVVETAGHACVATPFPSEALAFCDARRPDVVVTDLSMPRLDGQCLARWIKARFPTVPILLITGETLDDDSLGQLRVTFSAVLIKPIPIERFLGLLAELMPRDGRHAVP
jgi:CheY-like chemotaxis protein